MPDSSLQTTRFALQKIADGIIGATAGQTAVAGSTTKGAQMLEPQDYNALLSRLDAQMASDPLFPFNTTNYVGGTGVTVAPVAAHPWSFWRLRLTLAAVSITVTNAHKYGGTQILLWPNSNIVVLSARMNLQVTKDGVGILAADAPDIAVGSATASNTTLATTMIDTVEQVAMAGVALTEAAQKNGPHTAGLRFITAGATNKLFLNAGTTGNTGAVDGSLLASGTIDVIAMDLGLFGA